MDQQRWKKINSILDEALDLDSSEDRQILVSRRCKNDEKLYQEIILLLNYIAKADKENFLLGD